MNDNAKKKKSDLEIEVKDKEIAFNYSGSGAKVEEFWAVEPGAKNEILDWVKDVYGEESADYANAQETLNSEEASHLFLGRQETLHNDISKVLTDDSFRKSTSEAFSGMGDDVKEEAKQDEFRARVASEIDGRSSLTELDAEQYTHSIATESLSKSVSGEQDQIPYQDILKIKGAEAMIGKEKVSEIFDSVEQELAAENSVENSIETVQGDTFILSDNCPDKVIVMHLESGDYPMDEHGDIEAAIEAETTDILKDNKFDLSYEEARSQVAGSISEYSKEEVLEAASREEAWPADLEHGSYLSAIEDELRERVENQEAGLMERDLMDDEQIEEEFFGESDQLERILVERDISSENVPMEELRDIQHEAANRVKEQFANESESKAVSADDRQKSQYRELQRSMKAEQTQANSSKDLSEDNSQKQESDGMSQS